MHAQPDYTKILNSSQATPKPWRLLGVLANVISIVATTAAWIGTLAWGVGEIISDRYAWSQWLEWIPTIATVIGGFLALSFAFLVSQLARALTTNSPPRRRSLRLLRSAWLVWTVVLVYFFITETPFYKPRPEPPAFNQESFRLAYWNSGGEEKPGWDRVLGAIDADLTILNGLVTPAGMPGMEHLLSQAAPNPTSVILNERFVVISKRPLVRWGATSLGISRGEGVDPRQTAGRRRWFDNGRALFFQFASKDAAGAPIIRTAWIIDLPSDLSLPRLEVAQRASLVIETFTGTTYVKNAVGAWVPEHTADPSLSPVFPPMPAKGFPTPDFITGDFNIPRGSYSLSALTLRYPNAYHQAARRFCASWPRPYPFLHLDQTFLAPSLRAWSYRLVNVGSAEHYAQAADIAVHH